MGATIQVPWIPALQKDARERNTHSSTAIEGNPLTLEEVRLLAEGKPLPTATERSSREVLNCLAGLRFVERQSRKMRITHEAMLRLHKIVASGVMDQGDAGRYRDIRVRVGQHLPPGPEMVSGLMAELLDWWNGDSIRWSPVITAGIIHFRFEDIHPFADGNGRVGRALALWELYRRGFDTHHIFSVDEFYWKDRPRYYRALDAVRRQGGDLSGWLEYTAEGLYLTLESVWVRVQRLAARAGPKKIVLRPKQELLLGMLRDRKSLTPRQIREGVGISKQGAMNLLNPLLEAGMVRRIGTRKSGRYILA
ncbi:MAG: Fic family protein [Nitrospiraceae bacterium]